MPIEIRELVLKVNVAEKPVTATDRITPEAIEKLKQQIVRECKQSLRKLVINKEQR